MGTIIPRDELDRLREGSFESIAESRTAAVVVNHDGAVLLSTKPDSSVYAVGNDTYEITFKESDDGLAVETTTKIDSALVGENVVRFVGESLGDAVDAILSGEVPRNRLRLVSALAEKDGSYWASDFSVPMLEDLSGEPDWLLRYDDNRDAVRKALYGSLAKLESVVPSAKFSSMKSDGLADMRIELEESIGFMVDILEKAENTLKGSGPVDLFDTRSMKSLVEDVGTLSALGRSLLRVARKKDIGVMAEVHDALSRRLVDLVIVEGYVAKIGATKED